jgi:hypothetical protein
MPRRGREGLGRERERLKSRGVFGYPAISAFLILKCNTICGKSKK